MARILASGLIIQSSRVVPRKLCLSSLHGDEGLFLLPDLKEAYIMDKEKNTRLPLVDLIEVKPMQDGYRWVAITAMLFAIGIILHTVSPNVGGVTPNWTIAMYSIVINLTNPTLSQAVGIGFIAGITLVPRRSRLFRWAISPASFRGRSPAASWSRRCCAAVWASGSCAPW